MARDSSKQSVWQKRLLVVSLAFNLLIVGTVVGLALTGGGKNGMQRFDLTAGPIARAMDDDRRVRVRDALRDSGAFRPANRSQMRDDMAAILAVLRADEFDADAFHAALNRQRARLRAGQDAILEAVTSEIEDMTAAERADFADRLESQLRRAGPSRQRGD